MIAHELCDMNRLPLGLLNFSNIRKSNMIYVDKTNLIYKIAIQRSPIFFSRPRRFGKSLLINTLSSLFTKALDDFHGLDIEKMWNDKTYQVVHLDFSRFADKKNERLKSELGDKIIREFHAVGTVAQTNALGVRDPDSILDEILQKIPNNSTVLLIDEYDAPITHHINEPNELKEIMSILNDFYATVKQYTDKFRLIFITGVTRVSHVSIFSAFNNLQDLSLIDEFNSILGFTQHDLERYFDDYVENASKILNMKKEDVYKRIEEYYDGFKFTPEAKETVYNPWSILNFFAMPQEGFKNYWFRSGGISSLIMQYLKIDNSFDFFNYKNREIVVDHNDLSDIFEIDNIPRYLLLFQAGYFTISNDDYNIKLIVPNREIEESLLRLYLLSNNLTPKHDLIIKMNKLCKAIDAKDLFSIISIFDSILNECVSSLSNIFDDERSIRDIIYAALIKISKLQKMKEHETVKGKSDLELITNKTCMIIEFKRTSATRGPEASLKKAIEQIKKNRYGLLFSDSHNIYRVAMVISHKEKKILKDFCKEII